MKVTSSSPSRVCSRIVRTRPRGLPPGFPDRPFAKGRPRGAAAVIVLFSAGLITLPNLPPRPMRVEQAGRRDCSCGRATGVFLSAAFSFPDHLRDALIAYLPRYVWPLAPSLTNVGRSEWLSCMSERSQVSIAYTSWSASVVNLRCRHEPSTQNVQG
jgi:hypothetical protein